MALIVLPLTGMVTMDYYKIKVPSPVKNIGLRHITLAHIMQKKHAYSL